MKGGVGWIVTDEVREKKNMRYLVVVAVVGEVFGGRGCCGSNTGDGTGLGLGPLGCSACGTELCGEER